ncbi:hypothetical protein KMW28_03230 [Flammeovirga yaeyamensis]|uniref:Uncharacterized protein n=1 Tax=Flammeovirga yaeyamensis TaxID=367791 RepID=A0AAX1N992_9BACT|nr:MULTISPECIES: hypothetical protein [Flammeovirga]ANQ49958.1 hypothetical protein MY04_2589 [Flammeovirga sp. MY04]MBB3700531.1 hypothetical protein [Flammeovirga yaeyamensis]NMF36848.1 hypothetical protein [Flammeovirga yaeyamensis]QWG02602.1 hypothetical protein KMW28_03230 [Flammeovirga yaeyamensis]
MKKFHLLFSGLFVFFSLVFSLMVKADNTIPADDKKEIIQEFNAQFEMGRATYQGDLIFVEMDIKALSEMLGWAPDMFEEYCDTANGQETFKLFCDYVKESHGFEFEKSGFKEIQISLMKNDEVVQTYQDKI